MSNLTDKEAEAILEKTVLEEIPSKRVGGTYASSFVQSLQTAVERKGIGTKKEIMFSIPNELLEKGSEETMEFVRKAGVLSRTPEYHMGVTSTSETLEGVALLTIIFTYDPENTRVAEVIKFMEG